MPNVNNLEFVQLSATLAEMLHQATGQSVQAPINTGEFVSVGQTLLKTGYEPAMNAISQVLARTIFSVRPYTRKFGGLFVDSRKWGNHVRKINYLDSDPVDDDGLAPADASSVDPFAVSKPKIIQTNFYGRTDYERKTTVFRDQLDVAFTSPDEFASFIAGQMQNVSDQIEQDHETTARATMANLIAGIVKQANAQQNIHLLTEYNAATGGEYTSTTIQAPSVFPAFMKWVYARIASVSSLMTERSINFHTNITAGNFIRHTPTAKQRVFMYAPAKFETEARVLADTYHENYIRDASNEIVNFWQSIKTPDKVSAKPSYIAADGSITTETTQVDVANVFAVLMDEEAAGISVCNYDVGSIYNPRGRYANTFWNFQDRYWNDFTENAVVFTLD